MKKLLTIIFLIVVMTAFTQSPESINFQAVARDASGNLLTNQSVRFRISILQGSPSGTVVYSEWHLKTTNSFGLATLAIGQGTVLSGTFNSIGWGTNSYYVMTEMDPAGGTTYQTMGISQFLSVPYALYSKSSGSGGGGGTVTTVNTSSPITGGPITTTGTIGITQANGSTNGYLSSSDWSTFDSKQDFIPAGTNSQYFRGDKSWQTLNTAVVPEDVNLYFTPARTRGTLLTGLSVTNSPIVATDDILTGFGKTQGQINNRENPLTFTNGLTRATNTVKLGGNLTENTTITQDAAEALTFSNSGTGNTTIDLASTGDFEILDNGSTFFTATDAGRVGIGTASPSQQIEITQSFGLPAISASNSTGVIYRGADRFIHTYYPTGSWGNNTFVGQNAGNFSLT